MAKNPRLGEQFDFRGLRNPSGVKHLAHPGRAGALARRSAMIVIPKGHHPRAVTTEQAQGCHRRFGVEQHVVDRVTEGVLRRAPPAMKGLAVYMFDLAHAAATGSAPRASMAETTSIALEIPSSWKPFFIQAPQSQVLF